MPESLNNPNALTMRKLAELDPSDPRVLKAITDAKVEASKILKDCVEPLNNRIKKTFPWFTGSDEDWTKLEATLSLKLQKPFNWFGDNQSVRQYLAVIDAIAMNEKTQSDKPSRKQPEKEVTKWVRKNIHKYASNADAVRKYIEIEELPKTRYSKLYDDLNNDLRSKPLKSAD